LTRASGRTAKALGLSVRQLQRIVAGEAPVSDTLALLVIAYLKLGVPAPLWNPDFSKIDFLQQYSDRDSNRAVIAAARRMQ
jgi:transcriptional regulator with XRE-family HTH domain